MGTTSKYFSVLQPMRKRRELYKLKLNAIPHLITSQTSEFGQRWRLHSKEDRHSLIAVHRLDVISAQMITTACTLMSGLKEKKLV